MYECDCDGKKNADRHIEQPPYPAAQIQFDLMKRFRNKDKGDNVEYLDDKAYNKAVDKAAVKHIKELLIENQRADIPENNIYYIEDVQRQHR